MLAALCATLVITLAATPAAPERPRRSHEAAKKDVRRGHAASAARPRSNRAVARPAQTGSELTRARAMLAEVKRDPAKRRYRDRWEKAITALEKAARGRDTGPALLDAARGRYALYRFSQVDSDRTKALALTRRAEKAGARDARLLRVAIRQEMGDAPEKEPARPAPRVTTAAPHVATSTPKAVPRPAAPRAGAPTERPGERPATAAAANPATQALAAIEPAPVGPNVPLGPPVEARPTAVPAVTGIEARSRAGADEEPSIDAILERALAMEGPAGGGTARGTHALISDLKSWSNHEYTRVAIYLSRTVPFQRVELPAQAGEPRQVALDLRPAKLAGALAHVVGDTLVQRVRAVQLDPDTVRVTLELSGREELAIFPMEDPSRLIVDVGAAVSEPAAPAIASTGPERTRESPPAPPPVATAPNPPSPSDELGVRGPIRRVIVDAGHGGHDTGAIGPTNVREKDVTLAMAKRLASRLRARGYEVVLTRTDDRYVPLEERTAIANARHGDLFVSLHANAHPRRDRRGVETYVLNVADDRYAARLAARENGAMGDGAADIPFLRRILSDLDAKVSVESSRRLATAVQRELCAGIRSRFGEVRDLGVKSALFYVLLGARMPAVLVETAFISNRAEEKRLASAAFQDEVASAVVRAVERVSASDARLAAAR